MGIVGIAPGSCTCRHSSLPDLWMLFACLCHRRIELTKSGPQAIEIHGSVITELERSTAATPSGIVQLSHLKAGIDYSVKDREFVFTWCGEPHVGISFPNREATRTFRNEFIMRMRCHPVVPVFAGSPVPKGKASAAES